MSYGAWDRAPEAPGDHRERRPFGEIERRVLREARRGAPVLVAAVVSLLLHGTLVGGAIVWQLLKSPAGEPAPQEVELMDARSMPALPGLPKIDLAPVASDLPKQQMVALPKPAAPEAAPKDSRFLAEDDHRVKEETAAKDVAVAPKTPAQTFHRTGQAQA